MDRLQPFYRQHPVWSWVIIIFVGLAVLGALLPSDEEEESSSDQNVTTVPYDELVQDERPSDAEQEQALRQQEQNEQAGEEFAGEQDTNSARLSTDDFARGEWPLTVRQGVVHCEGRSGAGVVTFKANGRVWGVNGTAIGRGLPRIDPIWKKDRDIPGARVNISPILDEGLSLCD